MAKTSRTSGTLKDYFDTLTAAKVVAMKGSGQENHLIEFKTLTQEDFSEKNDKKNLASSLSAFSNSEGGLIFWGVHATKDRQDAYIDQITDVSGLKNVKLVFSRLYDLTAPACSPFLVGIEHRILKGKKSSFVVTYVPESDGGPHMAQLGLGKYYVRSGGSSVPMEHFQIADMFGRRASPKLEVIATVTGQDEFALSVRNVGRGAAHAPYLQVEVSTPFRPSNYYEPSWPQLKMDVSIIYAAETSTVVHPTMQAVVMRFSGPLNPRPHHTELLKECHLKFKVGALGIAPAEGELRISFL